LEGNRRRLQHFMGKVFDAVEYVVTFGLEHRSQAAMRQLSTDELRLLIDFMEAQRQGREWTSQELAAAQSFAAALERNARNWGTSHLRHSTILRGAVRNTEEEH
jgi:hypothetical protein